MKNKLKSTSGPKKKTKSVFKKTPSVKAGLSNKKKIPAEKKGRNKIVTPDKAGLRKTERELRETKERLRLLSEATEEGIALHDHGVIIDANDALARLFGYELSEMIGMKAKRLATPESWKVVEKHISHKSVKPYEGVGIRKDASTFICSLVGKPYKYKGRTLRLAVFHDITERKKAEEKLRYEEQRFRALAEQSSDIIIFVNREGIVTYENPAVEKLLGLKPAERIGVNLFDRIHPDDLKFARDAFNSFRENTSSKDINSPVRQIRLRHQDGSWRFFETTASKLLHNNIIETVIINLRDITERKKADNALRESESRFRAQYNGNPIPTLTWQRQGDDFILKDFNDRAKTIMGIQEKTFFKRQASEIYKGRQDILRTLQICFDEKRIIQIESVSEHFMPGKLVVITFVFVPPDLVMVHMEDITERKQAEDALREAKDFSENLIKTANVMIVALDTKSNVLLLNEAGEKITGFKANDVIGKKWFDLIVPRERYPEVWEEFQKLKSAGTMIDTFENPILTKSGEERIISWKNSTLAVNGKFIGTISFGIDITEHKRAEESLKGAELKFRTIFNSASDGILLAQPDSGKFFSANEKICAMLGYNEEELLKLSVSDIHPEESLPYVNEQFEKLFKKEILVAQSIPMLKKDKTVSFADISGSVITIDKKDYLIGIFRDITERMAVEEKLRKSEEKYRRIAENMSDFVSELDSQGIFKYNSPSIRRILGYDPKELIGSSAFDLVHPEDRNWVIATYMDGVKTESGREVEQRYRRKDGTYIWLRSSGRPIFGSDGKNIGMVVNSNDITERKNAENNLRESEELFRNLFNYHSAVKLIIDPDTGNIIDANIAAAKYYGWSLEQITRMNIYDINTLSQKEVKAAMTSAQTRQLTFFEFRHRRADGSVRDVEVFSSNISSQGKVVLHTIVHDITDRKRAEEELNKHREHLEELVRERTIKLEASNKELEAFSFSASHDLRAPVRTIDGFSQALLEDYKDKLDMQGKDCLKRIRAATKHMTELIDDLLQLSRITRTEINFEKINLTQISRSVMEELQRTQPQRDVKIIIADDLEETADSRLMHIVLENLLGNSWKFTEKQAQAIIEFGFMMNGDKKTYFIRDNGAGFDMAYMDKLFAPFQRLHTDDEFTGTGIGLAIVQRIIHRHGGRVWIEGQTGKGATVYFSINES